MDTLEAIGRKYTMRMLEATGRPRSATQLSNALDIPIATCYRRIDSLLTAGLLEECPDDSDAARNERTYRRTADFLCVRLDDSSVSAWARADHVGGVALDEARTRDTPNRSHAAPADANGAHIEPGTGETRAEDPQPND